MPNKSYDSSWDEGNDELWDKKYEEWENREWLEWLEDNLTLPFEVKRQEDMSENPFAHNREKPFSVGHVMKVISLEYEDEMYGVITKVQEGRKKGEVPLCDLEVTSRKDKNFWPLREYVVWFANR